MDRTASAPVFRVAHIDLFERPVRFARPLRIGPTQAQSGSQVLVRAKVLVEGRGEAVGGAADLMTPCWFDRSGSSLAAKTDGLRTSLHLARDLILGCAPGIAFARHIAVAGPQVEACADRLLPRLAADYGLAVVERAVLDALLRAMDLSFLQGMRRNVVGLDASLTPDLDPMPLSAFLASRTVADRIGIRHTVGLDDDLDAFAHLVGRTRLQWFKLALSGDPARDLDRLAAIARGLRPVPDALVTLDGDELYSDLAALGELCAGIERDGRLAPIAKGLLHIEQPFARNQTFEIALGSLAERHAFVIDEADDDWASFPRARALGYRGVSSRSCKGLYRTLLNAARAQKWRTQGQACFVTAEDFASPVGLAVQQDTVLAAYLGATHAERNGDRNMDGFADASPEEADAFLQAHPDLYERADSAVRLRMRGGFLSTRSLGGPGFASAAMPAWNRLEPMPRPGKPDAETAKRSDPRTFRPNRR